ncbi:cytochrome P450 [Macrolepiota fuliginosa MF-IS2]|uniref:Cytochrome P450 n=1 Tax=Macrolepiota fuliginosa MF-IS2 TaxID=1400762 RepID=A0A9P5X4U0_9AGAR|nr:cytochrome P450 [Macrolepiota fuliginosa MF-IS2]
MELFAATLLAIALAWGITLRRRRALRVPLPPSPPSDPILGHLRYIPPKNPELQYTAWSKIYGDVIYLRIFSRPIIVLNTAEAAIDLFEKRSWNYSDRPDFPIFNLMGWGIGLGFLHYGKGFQMQRRLFKEYFSQTKVEEYKNLQTTQARRLALSIAQGKEDKNDILRVFGTSIIVRIAFGHDMYSENDSNYDEIIRDNGDAFTQCGPPGGTPVDLFPILQNFPSWFPGTFFANRAREFYPAIQRLHNYPLSQVRKQMLEGKAKPSFLSYHLERLQQDGKDESKPSYEDVKGAASAILGGGADTIWATLSVFILAMVLHLECQEQAQDELDALLLGSRLPELGDRDALPYVECIIQETYRWLTVAPLGIPHRALRDDVYKGMFIPKGTTVFANAWGISRDGAFYQDADSFNPSRYRPKAEGGNEEQFPVFQFGFGRRVCPGRYLADGSFWIAATTILSLFKIERAKDVNGDEITPSTGLDTGLTSHPKPYKCNIRFRSEKARALLQEVEEELTNGSEFM